MSLPRRATAEAVGTALLLAAVVGSGIMGERLSAQNTGMALLANSLATGAALVALILVFDTISGAHFNPLVTLAQVARGTIDRRDLLAYVPAQLAGGVVGVLCAHAMFGERLISISSQVRSGAAQGFSELVATFGLLLVVLGCGSRHARAVPLAVGAYITAAYWFTASTSFANPAVTLARALTDSFSGIRPADVPLFLLAQVVGAAVATAFFHWLERDAKQPMAAAGARDAA